MRILIPHRILDNIYVRELGRAYRQLGHEVVFAQENFFECNVNFDLVHIHWPEALYRRWGDIGSAGGIAGYINRLQWFRSRGATIVWTVHNLRPHEVYNRLDDKAYRETYSAAHVKVYHCERSKSLLRSEYDFEEEGIEVVAAHGHYRSQVEAVGRGRARSELGLPQTLTLFLLFGSLRAYKGVGAVVESYRRLGARGTMLLVAGRFGGGRRERWGLRLQGLMCRSRGGVVRWDFGAVPSEKIATYMDAADFVIVGQSRCLNSGVAVLAMSYGKPVIGPAVGCVQDVLTEGRNVLWRPGKGKGLYEGLRAALEWTEADRADAARRNVAASEMWTWEQHAKAVLDGVHRHWQQARAESIR